MSSGFDVLNGILACLTGFQHSNLHNVMILNLQVLLTVPP